MAFWFLPVRFNELVFCFGQKNGRKSSSGSLRKTSGDSSGARLCGVGGLCWGGSAAGSADAGQLGVYYTCLSQVLTFTALCS